MTEERQPWPLSSLRRLSSCCFFLLNPIHYVLNFVLLVVIRYPSDTSNSKNMPSRGLSHIDEGLCNISECAAINPALAGSY